METSDIREYEFEGQAFHYDAAAFRRWSVQRAFSEGEKDPARAFWAYDQVFCGDADAVAGALGDDADKVTELFRTISKQVGTKAKN